MNVGVLGVGTMGRAIAQVCAMAGHEVTVRDVESELVERGIESIRSTFKEGVDRGKVEPEDREAALGRIVGTTDLVEAVAGVNLVVEAVPEEMKLKRETVAAVENAADPGAVIASNTSPPRSR